MGVFLFQFNLNEFSNGEFLKMLKFFLINIRLFQKIRAEPKTH